MISTELFLILLGLFLIHIILYFTTKNKIILVSTIPIWLVFIFNNDITLLNVSAILIIIFTIISLGVTFNNNDFN